MGGGSVSSGVFKDSMHVCSGHPRRRVRAAPVHLGHEVFGSFGVVPRRRNLKPYISLRIVSLTLRVCERAAAPSAQPTSPDGRGTVQPERSWPLGWLRVQRIGLRVRGVGASDAGSDSVSESIKAQSD